MEGMRGGGRLDPSLGLIDSLNYLPDVEFGVVVAPRKPSGQGPIHIEGRLNALHITYIAPFIIIFIIALHSCYQFTYLTV